MGYSCGIVGLPNVGKSTMFNALTRNQVASSNYPFCTIEPNVGMVSVPDKRLNRIVEFVQPKSIVPAHTKFIDIAGLVKGASEGEGLGNAFLSHIREVQAIALVLRLFQNSDIVDLGKQDPIADAQTLLTELHLKDLSTLDSRRTKLEKLLQKEKKERKKELTEELELIQILESAIDSEEPLKKLGKTKGHESENKKLSQNQERWMHEYGLLSLKPMLIIANIDEKEISILKQRNNPKMNNPIEQTPEFQRLSEYAQDRGSEVIYLSAKIEEELSGLAPKDAIEYAQELGIQELALEQLIQKGYDLLDLLSFFTVGEKECRAWTIPKNTSAQKAAGTIHSDFEKGFIRAEVLSYSDFLLANGSWRKAKELGKVRLEGKEYIVQDGDIMFFRFHV